MRIKYDWLVNKHFLSNLEIMLLRDHPFNLKCVCVWGGGMGYGFVVVFFFEVKHFFLPMSETEFFSYQNCRQQFSPQNNHSRGRAMFFWGNSFKLNGCSPTSKKYSSQWDKHKYTKIIQSN